MDAQKLRDCQLKLQKEEVEDEQENKALDAQAVLAARAAAEKVEKEKQTLSGGTVVGKNGKDTKMDSEAAASIQSNLNKQ